MPPPAPTATVVVVVDDDDDDDDDDCCCCCCFPAAAAFTAAVAARFASSLARTTSSSASVGQTFIKGGVAGACCVFPSSDTIPVLQTGHEVIVGVVAEVVLVDDDDDDDDVDIPFSARSDNKQPHLRLTTNLQKRTWERNIYVCVCQGQKKKIK